jgi:pimeloyl-ACP methyl ester carboxylesterase
MPYAENDGTKIYWEEQGSGPPLVLIMGLGYTSEMWHRVLPAVAREYRTILFDNRGVGRSDVPAQGYAIGDMAADTAAVMDAAGVERAHVLGISMGGLIAQEFALRYPERVRSLILGCTHHGGREAVVAKREVFDVLMARGHMPAEEGTRAMAPYIYDPATPRERVEEDIEIRLRTYPTSAGYFGQVQAILAFDARPRLPEISAPTLVLHGESDRLVPPENGRLLAGLIPNAKLIMLKGASHIFMTDQPEASISAILSFLRQEPGD